MPLPVVIQRLAGKWFGAKTAVIPSIRDLAELPSGNKAGTLPKVLRVGVNKYYDSVEALGKVRCCLR